MRFARMHSMTRLCLLVALGFACACTPCDAADDWPQFRGPDGQGHAAAKESAQHLERERKTFAGRRPLPGRAGRRRSSPAIRSGSPRPSRRSNRCARCASIATRARCVHDVEVFRKDDLGRIASKNTHASPTPVVDGQHVYVHFGATARPA